MIPILYKIAVFACVLGPLVFIHELGHFLIAKWCRVGVVKFAIGFGPALLRFKWGETYYQIGCIPLGGYVRMIGDMPDIITGYEPTDDIVRAEGTAPAAAAGVDSATLKEAKKEKAETPIPIEESSPEYLAMVKDRTRWFVEKSLWQRSAIVVAGPVFNFLFAVALVATSILGYGEVVTEDIASIGGVVKGAPAELAGVQKGDVVSQLDGQPVQSWLEMAKRIQGGTGAPVKLDLLRSGAPMQISVNPKSRAAMVDGEMKTVYQIGIEQPYHREAVSLLRAVKVGYLWSQDYVLLSYKQLWGMIRGHVSLKELAGPLYIFNAGPAQAEKGFESFISFMALLSVSLAALNLLPIPVLDGGHLLFFLMEAVVGPISIKKKEMAQQFGVVMLFLLMLCALGNDISRTFGAPSSQDPAATSGSSSAGASAANSSLSSVPTKTP